MRIWIDLANSPQVLFFRPIIAELAGAGHEIFLTSRNFAQTVALADHFGLLHTTIGNQEGKNLLHSVRGNAQRVLRLFGWARKQGGLDLALSHNSYSQAMAAALLRLPIVTLMDYEHQPLNHLCFRLARRVITPDAFPDEMVAKFGAAGKTVKFPGVKEQVYLSDFAPQSGFLVAQAIPVDKVVVVMRPPAPWTAYHRFENTLFDEVLERVASHEQTFIVFLPRMRVQGEAARQLGYSNLCVPPRALDGPNLLYHADLVISAGGTMNREAAVLGTPAYTVFKGALGAVDRYLMERGRLVQVRSKEDLGRLRLEKKAHSGIAMLAPRLVKQLTQMILGGR